MRIRKAAIAAVIGLVALAIAAEKIDPYGAELYRYLNFDQIAGFDRAVQNDTCDRRSDRSHTECARHRSRSGSLHMTVQ